MFNNQKFIRKNKVATSNEKSEVQKVPVIEPETVPIDSTQTKAEHEALAEEVKKDSIQSIEPGQEETKEVLVNFSPKFYLVAGGFKEEKNAETYLKELNEKGLEPFHMGLKDNFYLVGIGVYKSEAEAVRARREYAENHPGSGAWILEEE